MIETSVRPDSMNVISSICVPVLLNLINSSRISDKMLDKSRMLSLLLNSFIKSIKQEHSC